MKLFRIGEFYFCVRPTNCSVKTAVGIGKSKTEAIKDCLSIQI